MSRHHNHHHKQKILFILKKKKLYDDPSYTKTIHSGLFNSARFVSQMLNENGIESHCVQVRDNNDIDREVTKYKPTTVVIEALWVVPEKFEVLHKLHPKVKWIVRLHSEIPFIANEGMAMEWIFGYDRLDPKININIAPNTLKMVWDLDKVGVKKLIYLPNYYPVIKKVKTHNHHKDHVDIGCFGAIRPMKNQLIQAVASIEFGNSIGKPVHFHLNTERIEKGETVIKNIRALFENQKIHKLIEHPWYSHQEFIKVISHMDLGLQVSFNETFNIVAADFVSEDVPLIGSNEINWLSFIYKASPTASDQIVNRMKIAYKFRKLNLQNLNKINLKKVSKESKEIWCSYFKIKKH
jgi:hypothetical protein